ncbi:NAD(P)/FAD-dependent oxidoreductase [Saccharothrix obliqua]|uniref:NAD(P)/FAD-dependent oxidoreductase n=1 Tax=Saccharothrix obliqua TaxID=2861747 RepID=UPI001C5FC1D7|nr:NAD(P)/FAD-dependent oxidoreductase [Saccharothrix obliqua]MBW4720401.1 tryptophan 7-halogenase [Saccharothrix obliqua]
MSGGVDFEVGIIGGGPAGAAMAGYLARAGVECVVFEKDLFPRPHVGESLVPSSTRVFQDLGFLPTMESAGFPRKYGAAWTAARSSSVYTTNWDGLAADPSVDVLFNERDQPGIDQNHTYHVDRARFDTLLLQHVHNMGAQVYEGVNVTGAEVEDDHAVIRYRIGRREVGTKVRIVVDASGRRTLLGTKRRWRRADPVFKQYALHTWFDGFDRASVADAPEQGDFIFIHFLPVTNTWMWQIPITDRITSIGVVTQKQHFAASRASREQFFWDSVATRPELHEGLRAATQLRPLKEEGDYSYEMTQLADDRLVLVGDAARFVDPIFSTGVSIALNSSRFASADVLGALETGNFGRDAFARYERTLRRGTRNWYRFISVYYRLNVLFTAFVNDPRYRLDVLKLLQGDVYDEEEPAVLARMRDIVHEVEGNPDHIWHDALGDLTARAFEELSMT